MAVKVPAVLVAAFVACVVTTLADEVRKEEQAKMIDGAVLFGDMMRGAKWCRVLYPLEPLDGVFVIDKRHIEKPLKELEAKLRKLPNKTLRGILKSDTAPDFSFHFYSCDGKKCRETGEMGFWNTEHDHIYLNIHGKAEGDMRVSHTDCMIFARAIMPALSNIDNAIEALDVPDAGLKRTVMDSIVQCCFAEKAKKALPKMEVYLSDKNETTRNHAARMILKISPSHEGAKKVLRERKQ